MPNKHYLMNPEVSCRREADGATLFNPDTNDFIATNTTGWLVWKALKRACTLEEVVAHLVESCPEAPPDQTAIDVGAFLQTLLPRGFIGEVLDGDSSLPEEATARRRPTVESSFAQNLPKGECLRFYQGRSMLDTFQPGDYLTIAPVTMEAVHPGDVVIYRGNKLNGEAGDVVHRVAAITNEGLLTKGDNNPHNDPAPVTQENLIGLVTHFERKGRVYPVWSGHRGYLRLRALRLLRAAKRLGWSLVKTTGRPFYRWLRNSGLARRLWQPSVFQVLLPTRNGTVVKYVSGGQTVAWWQAETGTFRCRQPCDLVIAKPVRINPHFDEAQRID